MSAADVTPTSSNNAMSSVSARSDRNLTTCTYADIFFVLRNAIARRMLCVVYVVATQQTSVIIFKGTQEWLVRNFKQEQVCMSSSYI